MAYTLEPAPLPIMISTTALTVVELTAWEKTVEWFSNFDNISFLLIGSLASIYGLFVIVYIIHRLRRAYKRIKKRRREEMKDRKLEEQPMLGDDISVNSTSSNTYVNKLTYHGITSAPDKNNLYPVTNKYYHSTVTPEMKRKLATLHPPRPQMASKGPIKKMTTITAKPKTQIVVRCRCEGSMHKPGCHQFSVPNVKAVASPTPLLASSVSDVSVSMRDAMAKVAVYEHQLKTNPSMQDLLRRYRQMKVETTQRTWDENAQRGNWQEVPIAQLLERKKGMKERNSTSMS